MAIAKRTAARRAILIVLVALLSAQILWLRKGEASSSLQKIRRGPYDHHLSSRTTLLLPSAPIQPVDCSAIPHDDDPHVWFYNFTKHPYSAAVDAPWWFVRGPRADRNDDSYYYDLLFKEVRPGEIYVDVGANIGQTAMPALTSNVPLATYAFDPLEFDITKLCTGTKMNVEMGLATQENAKSKMYIFRSLVGNATLPAVNISRPDASFGRFEQASIFGNTVGVARKPKLVTETVPMVPLDAVIPKDLPIGMIKIDVQGFEFPVVQGMHGLLSKSEGYPHIVHYEEQARVTEGAGFKLGTVQKLLESYGYTCERLGDIVCRKQRKGEGRR